MGKYSKEQLAKIVYAVGYLEKMKSGLHPNNGSMLFDESDAKNKGIVNCLGFVCEVLGELVKEESSTPRPFAMTEQARRSVPISSENLIISKFTQIINEHAREPDMQRLRGRQITGWLLKNGYLEMKDFNGKKFRGPSEKGISVGISSNEYLGADAEYLVNLYSADAQRFILDHIDDIIKSE